jgi:L-lactate dehydrogenase complex protein LldF
MSESSACAVPESAAISVTVASGYRIQAGRILLGIEKAPSLPFASSLCGACYEVCPVKIDIPSILLHLRAEAVEAGGSRREHLMMRMLGWVFLGLRRFELAQGLGRIAQRPFVSRGRITRLPGQLGGWTRTRDLKPLSSESFREWWEER